MIVLKTVVCSQNCCLFTKLLFVLKTVFFFSKLLFVLKTCFFSKLLFVPRTVVCSQKLLFVPKTVVCSQNCYLFSKLLFDHKTVVCSQNCCLFLKLFFFIIIFIVILQVICGHKNQNFNYHLFFNLAVKHSQFYKIFKIVELRKISLSH